jgi:hypothetical protein
MHMFSRRSTDDLNLEYNRIESELDFIWVKKVVLICGGVVLIVAMNRSCIVERWCRSVESKFRSNGILHLVDSPSTSSFPLFSS